MLRGWTVECYHRKLGENRHCLNDPAKLFIPSDYETIPLSSNNKQTGGVLRRLKSKKKESKHDKRKGKVNNDICLFTCK